MQCAVEGRRDSDGISVRRVAEAEIGKDLSLSLQRLLRECFPGYPARSYFKLPPYFRYVATAVDGTLAGQLGVELRVVRVGEVVVRTFGLVDVCVRPGRRSRGLAGRLLAEVTGYARACEIDFIVLFADDDRLYTRNGWAHVANRCTWVKIDDHVTLGLARDVDPGVMMVKAAGDQAWPAGDVDLLGHLF